MNKLLMFAKNHITKKDMIIIIPAVIIGLLCNWVSYLGRVVYNSNYLNGFNALVSNPAIIMNALPLSLYKNDLLLFLAVTAVITIYLYYRRSNKKTFKPGEEHGSAKWGTADDIKEMIDPVFSENIILSNTEYLTMNELKDWTQNRNKNVLIVGGSGSGKTYSIIKPNIMQMHSSYVVTDPKGTILNEVGYLLEKNGYKIKVLNLIELDKSMKYNPLAYIKKPSDILKLIETLIANTNGEESPASGEDFWVKAERLLYQALLAAINYDFPEHEKNLGSVTELLSIMEVRESDETFKNAVDLWFDELREMYYRIMENPEATPKQKKKAKNLFYAVTQYDSYKLAAGKTAKSILISCAARLAAINIPEVKELLSKDELEIDKIGTEKTALFIIIPDTDRTYNFIASIMYTQLFNTLCTIADTKYGGKLPIRVRCLLDEFATVGKIPNWENLIATIRSRNISATMIVQTKSQLKAQYKEHAETIIGNCDSEVFLGGKETGTLKEIAESLGKQTIHDINQSDSRGSNESKSVNYSKLGKELMSLDELKVIKRNKCVVQISGLHPFFSKKYNITEHPMYKYHASGPDDKKWFDVEKYMARKNRKPISMLAMIKRLPVASKVIEAKQPLQVIYEGDEIYIEIQNSNDERGEL